MGSFLGKLIGYALGSILLYFIVYFVVGLFASDGTARIAGIVLGVMGFIYAWVAPDAPSRY